MSDLIKKEDAIRIVDQFSREEMFHYMESLELDVRATQICHSAIEAVGTIKEQIESLPSADRPTGEWVRKYDKHINCYWYECNQCGEDRPRNVFGKEWSSPYCPNCGARMTGGNK